MGATIQKRLAPIDVTRLAAEAGRDPRTVQAVLEGRGSANATAGVQAAARRLGIALEPSVATSLRAETPPSEFRGT